MNRMAITISQYLHFDMTWLLQETFHIHRIITKPHFRITLCSLNRFKQGIDIFYDTHTTTTTTRSSFYNQWKTDLFRFSHGIVNRYGMVAAWYCWYTSFFHGNNGRNLVPHSTDMFRTWTNKDKTRIFYDFGKFCIFSEESITRMDCICASNFSSCNNRRNIQVAVTARTRANTHCFITETQMHQVLVCVRIDTYSFDP